MFHSHLKQVVHYSGNLHISMVLVVRRLKASDVKKQNLSLLEAAENKESKEQISTCFSGKLSLVEIFGER